MRYLFLIMVLFEMQQAGAQGPGGKLYFFTGPGGFPMPYLGYVQYPDEIYHVVDTVQLSDITMVGNKLAAAAYVDVLLYDTSLNVVADTIYNAYARRMSSWNDQLVVLSIANPYFRVYDLQSHNVLFSLDTLQLSQSPTDIVVSADKAFLILADSVVVVDLLQQNIAFSTVTNHPIPFAGFNAFLTEAGNYLYIDVEYITGALRFSVMRMNMSTYVIDTAFHREGYANFSKPVLAGNDIYLGGFDTHYSILDDSLYESANQWSPFAADYDNLSSSIFLIHNVPGGVNYYRNGNVSDTILIAGNISKALFVPGLYVTHTSVCVPATYRVYPDPATDIIYLELPESSSASEIQIFNSGGRLVNKFSGISGGNRSMLDVSQLPRGLYLVRIISARGAATARFVK